MRGTTTRNQTLQTGSLRGTRRRSQTGSRTGTLAGALGAAVLIAASGTAAGGLVADQVGATFVSGGYTGFAAQSFVPQAQTLAAIEISIIGTAALDADVRVSVYSGWDGGSTPASLNGLLGEKTLADVPRGTTPLFVFDEVIQTTPGQEYYFLVEPGQLAVGGNRQNEYADGRVIFGGGNIQNGDLFFTTFAVPAPGGLAAGLGLGLIACGRRRA